jgi:hypothetical protein
VIAALGVATPSGVWAQNPRSPAGAEFPAAVGTAASKLLCDCLIALSSKGSPTSTQFYEGGVWHGAQEQAWPTRTAPGAAAAALWRWGTVEDFLVLPRQRCFRLAVETFDRAIRDHKNADGSFGQPDLPETMFFGVELGSAYFHLEQALDAATRRRWREALTGMVDALLARGDLDNGRRNGYPNGNLELGATQLVYYAWKAGGEAKYETLFQRQWDFLTAPPQQRWRGFGLFYTRPPTRPDGADGMAFLAESGGGEPGFDPYYTMLQADVAARLYLFSGDPRLLRLVNLLVNQLLPRVERTTWIIDCSGGSRKSLKAPFFTGALAVAAWQGKRDDLRPLVPAQLRAIARQFLAASGQGWMAPGMYRGLAGQIGVIMEAARR